MRHLPNALTALRLVLVPFIVMTLVGGYYFPALALFAAASVTDILDGAAARRYGSVSATGAYLDPLADKCLLSGVFLALALTGFVPWWLVFLIFGRDLFIVAGALIVMRATGERRFPPSKWGKASTFVQICTVAFALGRAVFPYRPIEAMAAIMIWPCALATLASGADYGLRGLRMLREKTPG
jgi:cardiolipin synthase